MEAISFLKAPSPFQDNNNLYPVYLSKCSCYRILAHFILLIPYCNKITPSISVKCRIQTIYWIFLVFHFILLEHFSERIFMVELTYTRYQHLRCNLNSEMR